MSKFMSILRNFGRKLSMGFRHFMMGRYGVDKLNLAILLGGLAASILASLFRSFLLCSLLTLLSYGLLIWAVARSLSRNTYKRYEENRRFLMYLSQLKDREHRYYHCPRCRQMTRVPRGKGKINIKCPRCGERFQRKS